MALVVETGLVVSGANAFITVAYADSYFSARGNTLWSLLGRAQKEQAIVQATDYIQIRWGGRLLGSLVAASQGLLFPRIYAYGGAPIMPDVLLKATAEYAVRASQAPLAPDYNLDSTGRLAIKTVEEVGPIREEVSYATNGMGGVSLPPAFRNYPLPDGLMKPILSGTSNSLIRA